MKMVQHNVSGIVSTRSTHTRSFKKTQALSAAVLAMPMMAMLGTVVSGPQSAHATTYVKTNTAGALNIAGSYAANSGVPGATDVILFNLSAGAAQTDSLGGALTVGELQLTNPTGAITITDAANALTVNGIGGLGIDLSAATQNLTINPALTLGNTQSWNLASGRVLTVSGVISGGSSGLTLNGPGTFNLTGLNDNYTGTNTINGAQLNVTFNAAGSNLNASSGMAVGGASVNFGNNISNTTNTQAVNGLTVTAGASTFTQGRISGGKVIVNLGAVTRSGVGGTVVFFPTSNSSLFSNTAASTNGIIGGWATYNGTDFAKGAATAGTVTTISAPAYTNDLWAAANNTTVTLASNTQTNATTNSLRFANTSSNTSVTLSGTNIISSGGILVSSAITSTALTETITGGTLEGAAGADLIVIQNAASPLAINSAIADNTSATALTKSGSGTLTLGGANTFTGGIYLNQGFTQLTAGGTLNGNAVFFDNNSSAILAINGVNTTIGALNTASITANTLPIVQNGGVAAAVLTINSATSGSYAGKLQNTGAGSLGLTKLGAGTQTLTGANTYTGPTTITGGILAVTSTIGSSTAITVGSAGTLDVSAIGAGLTIGAGNSLSGTGNIIGSASIAAGGNLTPGNIGTVGTLTISNTLNLSASTSTLNYDLTSGNVDPTMSVNDLTNVANLNISGGQFNLLGAGAAQTGTVYDLIHYSGTETGSPSALSVASGGTGGLTYTFGLDTTNNFLTLTIGGATAQTSAWNLDANGSWGIAGNWLPTVVPTNAGDTATFGSVITAPRTVTLDGSYSVGVLNFANANSYTIAQGTGGTLFLDNGAGSANVNDTQGSHFITAPVGLNSSAIITVTNAADTLTISGAISGTGALTKAGPGTLVLGTSNSYTGGTNINAGTLNFVSGSLGASTNALNFGGGTLQYATGNSSDISGSTVTFGAQAVIDTNGNNVTFANPVGNGGAGGLTKAGTGILTLASGNTFTGANIIQTGTLAIASDSALGAVPSVAGTDLTINGGATLQAVGSSVVLAANRNISLNGGIAVIDTNGNTVGINGTISGSGILNKTGAGTLVLGGVGTQAGNLVDTGTLQINNINALGGGNTTLNGSAGLVSATGAAYTFNNLIVNGNNFVTQSTNGQIGGLGKVIGPSTSVLTFSGTFVNDFTGDLSGYSGQIVLGSSLGYRVNGASGGQNATFNLGSGAASLSNRAGAQTISLGAVLGGSGTFLNGGQGGGGATTYSIGGANLSTEFDGLISDGATTVTSLTKVGTGTLTVTHANTYSGITTVNGGTLNINGINALGGANYGGATFTGGTLQYAVPANLTNGSSDISQNAAGVAKNVSFTNTARIDLNGNAVTYLNSVGNAGAGGLFLLDTAGGGSLTLDGVNTYKLLTTINPGTVLQLGDGTTGHDGTIATSTGVVDNGSLIFNRFGTVTSPVPISGIGTVLKIGAGSQTLTGNNNYSGGTTISAGTLIAGSATGLSLSSAFNLGSGTLDASGFNTSVASLSVGASGVLNLGVGTILSVNPSAATGVLTLLGGSTLNLPATFVGALPDTLINYNSESGTFTTANIPSNDYLVYGPNSLTLVSKGPASLTWNNSGGTPAGDGTTWSATSAQLNFNNGTSPVAYSDTNNNNLAGDIVTFNDANNGNYNVSITSVVHPTSTTVDNSAGNYIFNGSGGIAGPGGLTKLGTSSLTLNTLNSYTGPTNISGGSLVLGAAGALPAGTNLTIGAGASVVASNVGAAVGISVGSLRVLGQLDLNNNALVVHNGTQLAVRALVTSGYNNGAWNGATGIISTAAANDTTHLTALGILVNDNGSSQPFYGSGGTIAATFDGTTPVDGDILVKYTYYGDSNLDGKVDGTDYGRIDAGFLAGATGWANGDFNYDGVVNGSDYTLIDNAFNNQSAQIAAQIASPTDLITGGSSTGSSVPEPTTLGLLGIGAAGLLGRRRRR